ncbi:MAG: hypothetical protein HY899_12135 [Deltaproteobacteria bacterium]|nr:hypothetical protein [Deltaproteobacteria bacterium]
MIRDIVPGTFLLKEIDPNGGAFPRYFTGFAGRTLFAATDSSDEALWETDGTAAGTQLLKFSGLPGRITACLERSRARRRPTWRSSLVSCRSSNNGPSQWKWAVLLNMGRLLRFSSAGGV